MRSNTLSPSLRFLRALSLGLVIAALASAAGLARAADEDPPGRVGRLADLQGQAWVWNRDAGDWTAAERNAVLTTGDRIATEANGRAEVRVGSTTFRLDGGSELELQRVDDSRIDVRLHDGSAAVRVRNPEKLSEISVSTGEGRFVFQRVGRYRIDRRDDASHFTVDAGQGLYEGQRSALTVNAGQRAEFWLDRNGTAQYAITDPVRDAFASWTGERDRAEDRSVSSRYVSPEMTGAEDLDRYGRWQQHPEYGALWTPAEVAPGWAPYSTGRWAYVRPWGWTWVDEAPWGFAPFHYGRWVNVGGYWSWAPGQRVLRPVYAPALVAWIGGPSFSLSINLGGGPGVGWFPLAPREVWVPAYRTSPVYVRNVNITNVTNVTIIDNAVNRPPSVYDYRNRKFPHAVTVVPQSVLTSRERVTAVAPRFRDDPEVRRVVDRARPAAGSDDDDRRGGNPFAPPVVAPTAPPKVAVDSGNGRPVGVRPLPPSRVVGTTDAPTARSERPALPDARVVPPGREVREVRTDRQDRAERPQRAERPERPAPVDRVERTQVQPERPAPQQQPAVRPAPRPQDVRPPEPRGAARAPQAEVGQRPPARVVQEPRREPPQREDPNRPGRSERQER